MSWLDLSSTCYVQQVFVKSKQWSFVHNVTTTDI